MNLVSVLEVFNYGLVLLFGLFLSVMISGGWANRQQLQLILASCPVFLAVQGIGWLLWGVDVVRKIYPLIIHLPLVLLLIFGLKKAAGIALVSVCTAYLCCQLPRSVNIVLTALTASPHIGEMAYTLFIVPIFFLLKKHFVQTAYDAMTHSRQLLLLFGSLPCAYYLFDYTATVYSDALYMGIQVLSEFLPTALILFYVIFLTAFHVQLQKRAQTELQSQMLEAGLRQSKIEIDSLHRCQMQTAIYQHDMRHHLMMLQGLISAGRTQQAEEYIQSIRSSIEAATPRRICENESVNLLCSAFADRAQKAGISLMTDVQLPETISIPDIELCTVISNGLENAMNAVSKLPNAQKQIQFRCSITLNKLLLEIQNPCAGDILIKNGIPVSTRSGHGYGCRSIHTIAEQHRGLCSFDVQGSLFTLRLALPLQSDTVN